MNPFLIKTYHSPLYFCDREEETSKIMSAITNGRDILLISLRRMGKTGLLDHIQHLYKEQNEVIFIYFDIYYTRNLADFINKFGSATIKSLEKTKSKVLKKVSTFIKTITPSAHLNPITMDFDLDFKVQSAEDANITIAQIFDLIKASNKKIVIAIDEFQQIEKYPEKNLEAILRTYIQKINNLNMIYAGSSAHVLLSMFTTESRPFYQSTQLLELGPIKASKYTPFIKEKFESGGRSINEETINWLLKKSRHHTYYIQHICNRAYESRKKKIDIAFLSNLILNILEENKSYYFRYRDLLTKSQFNLLVAIAKEDKAKKITSSEFIRKHKLGATSTISSSIKALQKNEFIFKQNEEYYVYDIFFSLWMKMIY